MSTAMLRTSLPRAAHRASSASFKATAGIGGTSFVRGKATLPDLQCAQSISIIIIITLSPLARDDYGALEPSISGRIMELHHNKHHSTYVNSYNDASEKFATAEAKSDIAAQIALQPLINFHGGGHLNHTLFWENLAPKSAGGGEPPSGPLKTAIDQTYGGLDGFKTKFNTALASIQGSGWAWLVRDTHTGNIEIKTYANQDPVVGRLDYQNRKAEYFKAIWDVVNWKAAEKRFG
ncbi:MAG: hypothetical protein M1838_003495 [Thelocarpon superellum]|nr:MAG: hypothetical protein M1838_003495 [Thelocarpon superellum]